jgi:hypothetical protein
MAAYSGRDTTRTYTVAFCLRELGDRRLIDIDADMIADVQRHAQLCAASASHPSGMDQPLQRNRLRAREQRENPVSSALS